MKKSFVLILLSLFIVGCSTDNSLPTYTSNKSFSSASSSSSNITTSSSTGTTSDSSQTSSNEASSEDTSAIFTNTSSSEEPSSSQEELSSSQQHSESSSSSEGAASSDSSSSSSSQHIPETGTYIFLKDNAPYYYVGETFNQIYDINVTFAENGKVTDISNRGSSFIIKIKDSDGKEIDPSKPFEKAGDYSLTISMIGKKTKTEVSSDPLTLKVKDLPTKQLNQKTIIDKDLNYSAFEGSCLSNLSFPDYGNINALVIPVEVSDFPFIESAYGADYHNKIETAFCGNGAEDTLYWESVSSYYKESSFNQLNISFDVADTFIPGYNSTTIMNSGIGMTETIGNAALSDYVSKNGQDSLKKYDNDKDGYVDGLWLVYSAPDYSSYFYGSLGADVFWAFCTDTSGNKPNLDKPTLHSYGWASISFLTSGAEAPKVDTHTFIHETGHLFGLPDYYSYDKSGSIAAGSQGGLAMMDLNIGDHDSFSKMALGWANPYVATEDSIVTLKSNTLTGDCLLLADHWNGTAFDEYILLDFVTQDNLNALDSSEVYNERTLYYSEPGVRLYHVDARLGEFKYCYPGENGNNNEGVYPIKNNDDYYAPDSATNSLIELGYVPTMEKDPLKTLSERTSGFTVINANSSTRNLIEDTSYNSNRLLTLMSPDGLNYEIKDTYADNTSLFQKGQSWALNQNSLSYFNNADRRLNNGNKLGWSISVIDITAEEATILIKKY